MTADGCDACGVELLEEWIALGAKGLAEKAAIVCPVCAPIVRKIDRLVEAGRLDENQAAAMFEQLRWGNGNADAPRRNRDAGMGSDADVSAVLVPESLVRAFQGEARPCFTT